MSAMPADDDALAVAVVGMAGVFPGAATADALWRNVVDGVDAISDVPASRWDPVFYDPDSTSADRFYCRRGGFVDEVATFDPLAFGIMPVAAETAEPDQLLALAAAAAALHDAGQPHERVDPRRVGVMLGRGGYIGDGVARLDQRVRTAQQLAEVLRAVLPDLPVDQIEQVKAQFQTSLGPERPESSIGLVPNLAASRIANRFDLRGPAWTVDAACASSLVAVDQAVAQLRSGQLDVALAGGVHHAHDLTLWSVFTQLRALSPTGAIRPFSQDADGILIGEGTGLLVLKRLADALRDDDRVYAVVRGTGVASDGRASSLMSPQASGQVAAVEAAWRDSGLDPATVGLIEAHGTATPLGDQTELDTLRAVFGAPAGGRAAGLGSIKSMIGHAMPAAGAAGLIKTAFALHHRVLPPTLHAGAPHPEVAATRFRLVTAAEPWESAGPRVAGVNAFGFGGINAHVVLTEAPGADRGAPVGAVDPVVRAAAAETGDSQPGSQEQGEPVLLLAGRDAGDLLGQLDRLEEVDLGPAALRARPLPGPGPARLAIVAPDERRLQLARRVLDRGAPFRGRNDVWFDPHGLLRTGRVAFLFPGVEPSFAPRAGDVTRHFGLEVQAFGPLEDVPAGLPLDEQGRGILALGRLLTDALGRLGVRPDEVAGHSLGEWTGGVVSGMVDAADVDRVLADLRPGEIEVPDVVFVALGAGAEVAHELVAGIADAHVSHDNCPRQSVVCAPESVVPLLLERARERRVMAHEMPFRSGFHSPLFEPYVARLVDQFATVPFRAPATRLWSATAQAPYPDEPAAIADLSARHLVEPVRFRGLVQRLYAEGVRGFVQVGVGSLTGFLDDTLREHDVVTVAAHSEKRTGMAQLLRTAVALWTAGRDVELAALRRPAAGSAAGRPEESPVHAVTAGETSAAPPAASRPAPPLRMGSSLVRGLTPLVLPTVAPAAAEWSPLPAALPAVPPLDPQQVPAAWRHDYLASVHEATAAVTQVLEAAQRMPVTAPAAAASLPPTARDVVRRLSVDEQPWWRDHAFYPQPDGWPCLEDRFPLVPMTGLVELMAEEAAALVPGGVAVGLEQVRAFRWLAVEPAADARIRVAIDDEATAARDDGITVVRASIEGHTRAVVHVGTGWPTAPSPSEVELTGDLGLPPLERVYPDGHLFHGPAYQGLHRFDRFAEDGALGVLESKPATGALLDNAGQLFGYWVACRVDRDRLVLPTSLDRIEFYGPQPAPGTLVDCSVRCTELADDRARADLELSVDGRVWCRIQGWEDRRFRSDDRLFTLLRRPSELLAGQQPGGWMLIREGWPDSASREVVMRRFLTRSERGPHLARNPRAQRSHLLGRIAVKDAVRDLLRRTGGPACFPGEVEVHPEESGRPRVSSPVSDVLAGRDVRVSIAHSGPYGVALAAEGVDVGIDVEQVAPRSATFETTALSTGERDLFATAAHGRDRDRELTRWWAAKEAAAKAAGTGLGFRPSAFEVAEVDGDRLRIGDRWIATTLIHDPTSPDPSPAAPDPHAEPSAEPNAEPNAAPSPEEYVVAWTEHHH